MRLILSLPRKCKNCGRIWLLATTKKNAKTALRGYLKARPALSKISFIFVEFAVFLP